jgi:glycerophosphoryl diester phosphodiesterase
MKFPNSLKAPLMDFVNSGMSLIPRSPPTFEQLRDCKIVAHRGFRDELTKENTLDAFKKAQRLGAWGIEFDIRWTQDDEPAIHHDLTAQRVFNDPCDISKMTSVELRKRLPDIPFLHEVLREMSGRTHLMIELKGDSSLLTPKRLAKLESSLKGLHPVLDYHFMGLRADALLACKFVPREALLPIAEFNVEQLSKEALKHGMGGVTAQYFLLGNRMIRRHHQNHQKIGTGFVTSRSVLFREVNRGVDWVFSDYPDLMVSILKQEAQAIIPAGI